MKKFSITTSIAVFAVALLGCTGAQVASTPEVTETEQPQFVQIETVEIAIPAESALFWDIYVAEAEGFFNDNAINAQITLTPGPAATIAAMAGGAVDVGTPFAEQGLAAMEQGAPMSIFLGQSNQILVTVIGQKGITTAGELVGQSVVTSNVDDIATLLMEEWLTEEGVDPTSIDKQIVGSSGQRVQALETGAVAAATLTAPFDRQTIRAGFPVLKEFSLPGVLTAHFGTDTFLAKRPEAAARYAEAIRQATDWVLDPANRERALQILVARTGVQPEIAEDTYDLYLSSGVFLSGSPIELDLLSVAVEFLSSTGRIQGDSDPARFVDLSILESLN